MKSINCNFLTIILLLFNISILYAQVLIAADINDAFASYVFV